MLDPARDDEKFAWIQFDDAFAKFDSHAAAPNEKELVFLLVMMPGKDALEFYQLHFLVVEFADNLRSPMFAESAELFSEVHFLHCWILTRESGISA